MRFVIPVSYTHLGIPFYLGSTIAEAKGTDHVEKAVIAKFENGQIVKGTERCV